MKPLNIVLISVVLIISSCSVDQYVSISTNHPATSAFNADSTVIAVVNGFDFGQLNLHNKKKLSVIKGGAYASINYAETLLQRLHGVKTIDLAHDSDYVALDSASLRTLAAKYRADYILALTTFNAGFNSTNYQTTSTQHGHDKKTVDYTMNVTTNYTLYDRNGNIYKPLNSSVSDYNSTSEVSSFWLADVFGPGVKGNSTKVDSSVIHATQAALQSFFAYTSTINRPIYADKDLKEAADEITNRNFKKADSLLQPLLDNEDAKLAAKAAYNLAVMYEAQGDKNKARDMAQLSLDKNNNRNARLMLSDLQGNTNAAVSP